MGPLHGFPQTSGPRAAGWVPGAGLGQPWGVWPPGSDAGSNSPGKAWVERVAEGRPRTWSGLHVLDYKVRIRAKATVEAQC